MFVINGLVRRVRSFETKAGVPYFQVDLTEELAGSVRCSWERKNGYLPGVGEKLELRVIELQAWPDRQGGTPYASLKVLEPHAAAEEAPAAGTA